MTDSSNKRIAKNTAFLYVRMLASMLISLFTSRIILGTLGVTDYGIYNVVGGIVSMMNFINGALSVSTGRFLTIELGRKDYEQLRKTFSASLTLHMGVALLVFLLAETIGLWFLYEKLVIPANRMDAAFWVYQFSIITTMVSFTQVPYSASLISRENMSVYAYMGLYEAAFKLLLAYLIQISPIDKLVFFALLLMLNQVGMQMFYRYYTVSKYKECRFSIIKDKELYKSLLGYSGWDMFGWIAVMCQGQGLNILLNMFFGPVVNAARTIAFQIQMAIAGFSNNFLTAVSPQITKSYAEGNIDRMYELTFATAKFSYLLFLMFILPLIFEIDFVLHLWLGDNVPTDTNIFSLIILITYLIDIYHNVSLISYHAIGKIRLGNILEGSLLISALPVSYIVLKLGADAYSVFIIVFITVFIKMLLGWWLVHRYVPFSYLTLIKVVFMPCLLITLAALITPSLIKYYMTPGWPRFLILSVLSEAILISLILKLALNQQQRSKLFSLIRERLPW